MNYDDFVASIQEAVEAHLSTGNIILVFFYLLL